MSIKSEIQRIRANVSNAYAAVEEKGGTLPAAQNSAGLAEAVRSIPAGGGASPGTPLDPVEVYKNTRSADWLPMPEPQDNEMYLLFHIPDGVSSLLAFTATCTGSYTVGLGTVTGGKFVQQSAVSVASGGKYEAELFASDFGDLTSAGMKQVMVKVTGTDIKTWEPSPHSKKTSPANFVSWNIVEIVCRLPNGTKVACGGFANKVLGRLRYFSWHGTNEVTSMDSMFSNCYSLTAIPQLDTSKVTGMGSMFTNCYALTAIPQLDTSKVTSMSSMFFSCYSLTAIPQLDTSKVTGMGSMFNSCRSLTAIPQLDTSKVTSITGMIAGCTSLATIPQLETSRVLSMQNLFSNCPSIVTIPRLDTSKVTNMTGMFNTCPFLSKVTFNPSVTGWAGYDISLADCSLGHQALVDLLNSLPTITASHTLTLTGNPGVAELTDAEKAIATGKNWTLTL